MSDTVLVTGVQGFIGRYTAASLLAQGCRVIGTGRSRRSDSHFTHKFTIGDAEWMAPLPPALRPRADQNYVYAPCDMEDRDAIDALLNEFRPARVIHLAGALRDEDDRRLAAHNRDAAANVAAAMARFCPGALLILGSSGSVFGEQPSMPIAEHADPAPVGAYAISKRDGELAAQAVARQAGLRMIAARIFNVVGPGVQTRHLPGYLAHKVAEIEANICPPEIATGTLSAIRDLIDVRDVARHLTLLDGSAPPCVNIASGQGVVMSDMVNMFAGASSVPFALSIDRSRDRAGVDSIFADVPTISRMPGSLVPLKQSVADMLDYARFALAHCR